MQECTLYLGHGLLASFFQRSYWEYSNPWHLPVPELPSSLHLSWPLRRLAGLDRSIKVLSKSETTTEQRSKNLLRDLGFRLKIDLSIVLVFGILFWLSPLGALHVAHPRNLSPKIADTIRGIEMHACRAWLLIPYHHDHRKFLHVHGIVSFSFPYDIWGIHTSLNSLLK